MAEIGATSSGRVGGRGRGGKRRAVSDEEASLPTYNNRLILGPKYLDHDFMRKIGIYDDVFWMFHNIGLDNLFHMDLPAYTELCVEFFSTLTVNCESAIDVEEGEITFVLGSKTHKLSIPEFNRVLDFPPQGHRTFPENYDEEQFGVEITGCKWYEEGPDSHKGRMKALDIQNPCFRVVQRYFAYSIFGRQHQQSELRQEELFFLWSMLNNHSIDIGYFLSKQLHKVASSRSHILMGGLITYIAVKLGVDFTSYNPIAPSTIDEQHCVNIRLIRATKKRIHLIYRSTDVQIKLPAPNRTTIREKANWILFTTPVEYDHASSRPPEAPSTSEAPPDAVMHDDIDTHRPGIPEDMYTFLQQQNARLQERITRLEEDNARLQQRLAEDMEIKGAFLYIKSAIMDMKGDIAHMKGDIGMVLDRQAQTDQRIGRIESLMEELDLGIARVDSPK